MDLQPGTRLGPYEVIASLGSGGMGEVYKARDTRLHRVVALKVIAPERALDPQFRERFEREAHLISQLNHPNICTLYDVGHHEGRDFLVMEFVEGEALVQCIGRGPLGVDEALDVALKMAQGLTHAHAHDILHRDIKPANVMVTPHGFVKLLDFGLAKVQEPMDGRQTHSGVAIGTLAYMSPEQLLASERLSPASDVWSLGVVLYEMLAGSRPFGGSSEVAVFKSIVNDPPPEVEKSRPEVPRAVGQVIRRCLDKDPNRRFQSAAEFSEALTAARARADVVPATRRPRARLIATIAVATALGAVAIVLGGRAVAANRRVQWAREEALPQIERLIEQDQYVAAFALARQAEPYLAADPRLAALWPVLSVTGSLTSVPPGAEVFVKEYATLDAEWRPLGTTPLSDVRLPRGAFRFRIEKEGFEPVDLASAVTSQFELEPVVLSPLGSLGDMVRVPAGAFPVNLSGFNSENLVSIDAFLIDRHEVTNRAFKEFVDAGGYQRPEWWRGLGATPDRFASAGGPPGPATWEAGVYPPGRGDDPVGGVSWYEAAAYCTFRGRRLPTVFHWARAALAPREIIAPLGPSVVPLSNFAGKGPVAVATQGSLGPYGTHDLAGNVREWTWNGSSEGRRWILGGAWNDPDYMFSVPFSLPPADRSATNGFRCMRSEGDGGIPDALLALVDASSPNYRGARPVSDETFSLLAKQFAYVPSDAPAVFEARETMRTGSVRERVTLDAGYNDERLTVYVFLPPDGRPPYQAVVYFPALNAFQARRSSNTYLPGDYVVKSGRALVMPVYKGSFERWDPALNLAGEEYFRAARQRLLEWRQDLGRTIDYLGTRGDIDATRIAYYGRSFGASMPLPLLALETRIRAAVLQSAGFTYRALPAEMDAVNYVPRIKMPVLMLTGRHDYVFPYQTSQQPLFELLGTPAADKRHIVYEAGHDFLPRSQVIREILGWLDRYLGPAAGTD